MKTFSITDMQWWFRCLKWGSGLLTPMAMLVNFYLGFLDWTGCWTITWHTIPTWVFFWFCMGAGGAKGNTAWDATSWAAGRGTGSSAKFSLVLLMVSTCYKFRTTWCKLPWVPTCFFCELISHFITTLYLFSIASKYFELWRSLALLLHAFEERQIEKLFDEVGVQQTLNMFCPPSSQTIHTVFYQSFIDADAKNQHIDYQKMFATYGFAEDADSSCFYDVWQAVWRLRW